MKYKRTRNLMEDKMIFNKLVIIFSFLSFAVFGNGISDRPVTPGASDESGALLRFIYNISGKYTLSGQHNFPDAGSRNTQFVKDYIGKTPVIFSSDWGFAEEGDKDSYKARPEIVKECIRQHEMGSIITICWHAVPPTADEPVTFRPLPGANPEMLKSVQGKLLDNQFKDILTPGTELYKKWCAQVDTVAKYLKLLQYAKVPVLWRPYHELNGDWFWWGGRIGEYSTVKLYRQLFDRLVNYHKLNNLIWMWSVDRYHKPEMYYSQYFPGSGYVDVLTLDVYENDFNKDYYDSVLVLAKGKPIALAEVGTPPAPEILKEQPLWAFYSIWSGLVRNTLKSKYRALINDPDILFYEDSTYRKISGAYRLQCGMQPLELINDKKVDFTGSWVFNEDISILDNWGAGQAPWKMNIVHNDSTISVEKTNILEYKDNETVNEFYKTDGSESKSLYWNRPMVTTVKWSGTKDSLIYSSLVTFEWAGNKSEVKGQEIWTLQNNGNLISIHQTVQSFWRNRDIILIYEKEKKY